VIAIVANKIDIETREISTELAQGYAKQVGARYYETSALTGAGIEEMFVDLAKLKLMALKSQSGVTIEQIIQDEEQHKPKCC